MDGDDTDEVGTLAPVEEQDSREPRRNPALSSLREAPRQDLARRTARGQ